MLSWPNCFAWGTLFRRFTGKWLSPPLCFKPPRAPTCCRLDSKEDIQKYGEIILDFSYLRTSEAHELKVENNEVSPPLAYSGRCSFFGNVTVHWIDRAKLLLGFAGAWWRVPRQLHRNHKEVLFAVRKHPHLHRGPQSLHRGARRGRLHSPVSGDSVSRCRRQTASGNPSSIITYFSLLFRGFHLVRRAFSVRINVGNSGRVHRWPHQGEVVDFVQSLHASKTGHAELFRWSLQALDGHQL